MSYDTKCHELALVFLQDEGIDKSLLDVCANDLAQQIQDLIESFLEYDLVELRELRERGATMTETPAALLILALLAILALLYLVPAATRTIG